MHFFPICLFKKDGKLIINNALMEKIYDKDILCNESKR